MNKTDLIKHYIQKHAIKITPHLPETNILFLMHENKTRELEEMVNKERFHFCVLVKPDNQHNLFTISHLYLGDFLDKRRYTRIDMKKNLIMIYEKQVKEKQKNSFMESFLKICVNRKGTIDSEVMLFVLEKGTSHEMEFGTNEFDQKLVGHFGDVFDQMEKIVNQRFHFELSLERKTFMIENKKTNLVILYNNKLGKIVFMIVKGNKSRIETNMKWLWNQINSLFLKFVDHFYLYVNPHYGVMIIGHKTSLFFLLRAKNGYVHFISNNNVKIKFPYIWFLNILKTYQNLTTIGLERKTQMKHFIESLVCIHQSKKKKLLSGKIDYTLCVLNNNKIKRNYIE